MRVCIGQWSGLDATDGILFVECTLTNRFLLIRGLFADYLLYVEPKSVWCIETMVYAVWDTTFTSPLSLFPNQ